jgi:hypothetical protein
MKNEPVVSYNHMEEDDNSQNNKEENIPISLYMLLVVDAILISAIVVFAAKIMF